MNWGEPNQTALTPTEIYERDIAIIDISEYLFAEVSGASHGVGLEIAYAIWVRKIPVFLFVHESKRNSLSSMLAGNPHIVSAQLDNRICVYRTIEDVKEYLLSFHVGYN